MRAVGYLAVGLLAAMMAVGAESRANMLTEIVHAMLQSGQTDPVNQKFQQCCKEAGMTDCWQSCVHPPPTLGVEQQICLANKFHQYVHCATGGKDNRECCKKAGVTKQCLDLCYDSNPSPSPKYIICTDVEDQIAKCNHDANK